jgi:hypothetical protein
MSKIEVDAIEPQSGTTLTLGASGDAVNIASGATITDFTSTGIDDNATSTAITIDSSENVGIKTTTPATELDISSGATTGGTKRYITLTSLNASSSEVAYADVGVTFNQNAAGNESGGIDFRCAHNGSLANRYSFGGAAGDIHTWYTGTGTERMRITSGGGLNVGSGVLSAASTDGDIVVDLGIVIGTYNGDNRIAASSLGGGSATLYIGNAAIQVSSDRRLKTNIADTTMSAVDKIKQVRIVDFNWNDPSDTSYNNRNARGTWTGVIAQELIDVFPFAVNAPRKEEDLSIDTESEKKWQVDQAHLVPVLMKAIQEQQTTIEQLEARITTLENK